jgi:hypothetical protein
MTRQPGSALFLDAGAEAQVEEAQPAHHFQAAQAGVGDAGAPQDEHVQAAQVGDRSQSVVADARAGQPQEPQPAQLAQAAQVGVGGLLRHVEADHGAVPGAPLVNDLAAQAGDRVAGPRRGGVGHAGHSRQQGQGGQDVGFHGRASVLLPGGKNAIERSAGQSRGFHGGVPYRGAVVRWRH